MAEISLPLAPKDLGIAPKESISSENKAVVLNEYQQSLNQQNPDLVRHVELILALDELGMLQEKPDDHMVTLPNGSTLALDEHGISKKIPTLREEIVARAKDPRYIRTMADWAANYDHALSDDSLSDEWDNLVLGLNDIKKATELMRLDIPPDFSTMETEDTPLEQRLAALDTLSNWQTAWIQLHGVLEKYFPPANPGPTPKSRYNYGPREVSNVTPWPADIPLRYGFKSTPMQRQNEDEHQQREVPAQKSKYSNMLFEKLVKELPHLQKEELNAVPKIQILALIGGGLLRPEQISEISVDPEAQQIVNEMGTKPEDFKWVMNEWLSSNQSNYSKLPDLIIALMKSSITLIEEGGYDKGFKKRHITIEDFQDIRSKRYQDVHWDDPEHQVVTYTEHQGRISAKVETTPYKEIIDRNKDGNKERTRLSPEEKERYEKQRLPNIIIAKERILGGKTAKDQQKAETDRTKMQQILSCFEIARSRFDDVNTGESKIIQATKALDRQIFTGSQNLSEVQSNLLKQLGLLDTAAPAEDDSTYSAEEKFNRALERLSEPDRNQYGTLDWAQIIKDTRTLLTNGELNDNTGVVLARLKAISIRSDERRVLEQEIDSMVSQLSGDSIDELYLVAKTAEALGVNLHEARYLPKIQLMDSEDTSKGKEAGVISAKLTKDVRSALEIADIPNAEKLLYCASFFVREKDHPLPQFKNEYNELTKDLRQLRKDIEDGEGISMEKRLHERDVRAEIDSLNYSVDNKLWVDVITSIESIVNLNALSRSEVDIILNKAKLALENNTDRDTFVHDVLNMVQAAEYAGDPISIVNHLNASTGLGINIGWEYTDVLMDLNSREDISYFLLLHAREYLDASDHSRAERLVIGFMDHFLKVVAETNNLADVNDALSISEELVQAGLQNQDLAETITSLRIAKEGIERRLQTNSLNNTLLDLEEAIADGNLKNARDLITQVSIVEDLPWISDELRDRYYLSTTEYVNRKIESEGIGNHIRMLAGDLLKRGAVVAYIDNMNQQIGSLTTVEEKISLLYGSAASLVRSFEGSREMDPAAHVQNIIDTLEAIIAMGEMGENN